MVVVAGFFGFCTLFLNTNIFVKAVAIGGYLNCFLSSAPFISFTSYVSLLFCCYFYILCTKIEDWKLIGNTILALIGFNLVLMTLQFVGKDSLLNFGLGRDIISHGVIGSRMQLESFLLVSLVLLTAIRGINKKIAVLTLLAFCLILGIYSDPILHNPLASRLPVWKATIKLANQHYIAGFGIGTYKDVFFPLSGLHSIPWKTAHNDFLQILFETGRIGFAFIVGVFGLLLYKLWHAGKVILFFGTILIAIDMNIHFPMRVANIVLILIAFLAYCTRELGLHKKEGY